MDIESLINKNEDKFFERKSAKIRISKLAASIIGFANADGGTIVIGIRENKLEGINEQGKIRINDFIQCGFDKCNPSVQFRHKFIDIKKENGKNDKLLLLEIEPSVDILYVSESDDAYLRVGDETKKLSYSQRKALEFDKGIRLYEESLAKGCKMNDLNLDLIKEYKKIIGFSEDNLEKLLYARGFAKRIDENYEITNAGALMFADYPTIFVAGAKIRFIRYEGNRAETGVRMNIIKDESVEAPIPLAIKKIKTIIQSQLREFTALNIKTGRFVTVPEYPEFSWQEGVINALTHRAYNIQGEHIKIIMYDDRLEIISPGTFPHIVNSNNIKETRYSRNPKIARALTEMGWVKELGEGVKRIYEEMNNFFLDEPIYEEENHRIKLTLKNNIVMRRIRRNENINKAIEGQWDKLSEYQKKALELVYNKGKVRTMELAKELGITRQPARKVLEKLKEMGVLQLVSTSRNDPNQYYEMAE